MANGAFSGYGAFRGWPGLGTAQWFTLLPKPLFTLPPPTWSAGFDFPKIGQDLARQIGSTISTRVFFPGLTSAFVDSIRAGLPSWEDMARGIFPSNIAAADADLTIPEMKSWMLDEGLPIAWALRPSTIAALHRAQTKSARRAAIGRRWESVLDDSEALLARIISAEVAPFASFAQKAILGARAGHHELAQAFVANTLDTTIRRWMPQSLRNKVTSKKKEDPSQFSSRQFFAFAQLQGIYGSFFPDGGDPVPSSFNRHGSAHAVSKRQYSRINAVIAVAHLASWLWFVDTTFSRRTTADA